MMMPAERQAGALLAGPADLPPGEDAEHQPGRRATKASTSARTAMVLVGRGRRRRSVAGGVCG